MRLILLAALALAALAALLARPRRHDRPTWTTRLVGSRYSSRTGRALVDIEVAGPSGVRRFRGYELPDSEGDALEPLFV